MVLHHVNNIEYNLKQNIYIGSNNLTYTSMILNIKTAGMKVY